MEISENLFKDFVANIAIVNSSRVNEGDIRLTAEYFKVNAISK